MPTLEETLHDKALQSTKSRTFLSKQASRLSGRYIGFKERAKLSEQSDRRRGLIHSALYACIDEDDGEDEWDSDADYEDEEDEYY